ncbi:MAG TPA: hypothetical protein VFQ51_20490 [Vicinamibacteria bacterium]|nr:hypothetical protein [Vicinamibacteria bacterium]
MSRSVGRGTVLAAAVLLAASRGGAQDAHYWTYGYGPVGQLTEGVLVGGVNDLSAVYYNPGALALIEEPRFVFGLTSIELASIQAPDAAGNNLDFDSLVFDVVPSMVAGRIGSGHGNDRFAFAFLSRHDTDWDLAFSDVDVSAAASATAGFGRARERVVEYWIGGTWSHRVHDRLSFGASPFVAYRAQRSRRALTLEALDSGTASAFFVAREDEYDHVRALAKLGVAWRPGRFELGLAVTTPGITLHGAGRVAFNATATGDVPRPLLSASSQDGLDASFRSPLAVAAGASWRGTRTTLHSTVEWFSGVDPYEILSPEPAPVAGTATTIPITFQGAADAVVNFGVGVEHRMGSRFTLYGGAARNASSWRPESETLATWDLVDVTAGLSFERGSSRLAIGVAYAWGSEDLPRVVLPPDVPGPAPLTSARFGRWTFSLGGSVKGGR